MQVKALEKIEQPSKEPQAEQTDLHGASARTLKEPDEAAAFEFDADLSSAVERKRSTPVEQIQTKGPLFLGDAGQNASLLASRKLFDGRPNLFIRESAPSGTAET